MIGTLILSNLVVPGVSELGIVVVVVSGGEVVETGLFPCFRY